LFLLLFLLELLLELREQITGEFLPPDIELSGPLLPFVVVAVVVVLTLIVRPLRVPLGFVATRGFERTEDEEEMGL